MTHAIQAQLITPRATRLVRAPDLRALHGALAVALPASPADLRDTALLVPSRGAAEALRRTLENRLLAGGTRAAILPDILTRDGFYARLHERLPGAPRLLTGFEREVLFRRAARETVASGVPAPFALRAGLIVELLAFHDELRRRDRTLDAFERLMVEALEPSAETDRGAARLLALTRFLVASCRAFDARSAATGALDEHALRTRVLEGGADAARGAYRHVFVTVADQAADPRGLWMADYDFLARMPGLERLDVFVTEHVLASGFHERLHDALPGIEEVRASTASVLPALQAPAADTDREPAWWHVCRDREEELAAVARLAKDEPGTAGRLAVVFQRPLPYLYLARRVFPDARVPYHAVDALPLAAEPVAAALDLIFAFLLSDGTRAAIVELLASPHWTFTDGGRAIAAPEIAAADALLKEVRYHGGWERLASLAGQARAAGAADGTRRNHWRRARPALEAAVRARHALAPLIDGAPASRQIAALVAFVAAHERLPQPADPWHGRHLRARSAIVGALRALAEAHARHDDSPLPIAELVGTIRRWIEGQTFSPRTGASGVLLVDAPAAAYADADDVRIVGMADGDWPERHERSIFYPSSLLLPLGWPSDSQRLAGERARFRDLVLLARRRVSASTFLLEDDAIVTPSTLLEDLPALGLAVERVPPRPPRRIFQHEALSRDPVTGAGLDPEPAAWLAVRAVRSSSDAAAFRGAAGERPAGIYAVSHLERYLDCPFKYFAGHVLRLREERDDESVLTPQERGQLVHEVFETFFTRWQAEGHGAITTGNVAAAMRLFVDVADARLATLPDADRALERTHLLGSAAAAGLAERAFAFEIEQGGEVIERLLEHVLEGTFAFEAGARRRRVALRAKVDRIDLLADGTFRVIDYKLGKAPKQARALQLPVYGACAGQALAGRHGRSWTLGLAGYVAFRERQPFTPLGGSTSLPEAMAEGQSRLLDTLEAVERGDFPPKPAEPFICTRCGYVTVCRKDYVGDE